MQALLISHVSVYINLDFSLITEIYLLSLIHAVLVTHKIFLNNAILSNCIQPVTGVKKRNFTVSTGKLCTLCKNNVIADAMLSWALPNSTYSNIYKLT